MKAFSNYDLINRDPSIKVKFKINDNFQEKLLKLSYEKIFSFLKFALPGFKTGIDRDECVHNFLSSFEAAKKQNLISYGGIPEKNYLALSLISQLLNPTVYVESGFYKGCSMLAASEAKNLKCIIGFDPNHSSFEATLPKYLDVKLLKTDFSEYTFEDQDLSSSLLYFDDHINTAQRIIQASNKGFKNLIFDDSLGLMGSVQRVYPSLPSLFFINHVNDLSEDDIIHWSLDRKRTLNFFNKISVCFKKKQYFSFRFDKSTIELCLEAKKRISSIQKIPNLNDYIYSETAMNNDLTQHFVVLK
jgi:hypothetical protein